MTAASTSPTPDEPRDRPLDVSAESERPWSTPGQTADAVPGHRTPTAVRKKAGGRPLPTPDRARDTPHNGNRLLTVAEVAAWLRVSETSVRNKYRRWGIKPQKVGRLLRFRERDITHYLDEHHG